jgi:hypothetical protein
MRFFGLESRRALFEAYRAGVEGVPTFGIGKRNVKILRDAPPGRCEQFLLCEVDPTPFLKGSKEEVYSAGRALSYLYAYFDIVGILGGGPMLTDFIVNEVKRNRPPYVRTIFRGFERLMHKHGFVAENDGRVTFEQGYMTYATTGGDKALDMREAILARPRHSFNKVGEFVDHVVELIDGVETPQLLWILLLPQLIGTEEAFEELNLSAPYKTMEYLQALVLQTQPGRRILSGAEVIDLFTTLERIVAFYRDLPSWREIDDARLANIVANAFAAPNFSAPLISIDQERLRTRELLVRFPEKMRGEFGAEADGVESALDDVFEAVSRRGRIALGPRNSPSSMSSFFPADGSMTADDYWDLIGPRVFAVGDLEREETARVVQELSCGRTLPLKYRYFAGDTRERNPAEEMPIVSLDDGRYFVPSANAICHTVHSRGLRAITVKGDTRRRDAYLEEKVAAVCSRLFPDAKLYRSYKPRDEQGEYDLIIVHGRTLINVESKAAAAPIGFRDPAPALKRLNDAAGQHDSPIYGIEQGQRLARELLSGNRVTLKHKRHGTLELKPDDFDDYFVFCVTLFDWAALVIDWNLWDMVDQSVGYPWAVDLDKFETIAETLLLRGWDGSDLQRYLLERSRVHGRIQTLDELDYAAGFVLDGSLNSITCSTNSYLFPGKGPAGIFDELEVAKQRGFDVKFPPCDRPSAVKGKR